MKWYHGGPKLDRDATHILPPDDTGATDTSSIADAEGLDAAHVRTDRVFLTDIREIAVMFAAGHLDPWLYEVEPEGPIEVDPDYLGGEAVCVQTPRARIVRRLKPSNREVALGRHALYLLGKDAGIVE